jgi:hypothetical protein
MGAMPLIFARGSQEHDSRVRRNAADFSLMSSFADAAAWRELRFNLAFRM